MINTDTQRTIQRSSSWAINYMKCFLQISGDGVADEVYIVLDQEDDMVNKEDGMLDKDGGIVDS